MAKARMLHKKISVSAQVNSLSLGAKLLFTWLIPHADDEGRIKGSPEYVKALVVPMMNWSFKKVANYLQEIKDVGLINHWERNGEWFIEFIKWKEHQIIRKDRLQRSILPPYSKKDVNNDNQTVTVSQPVDSQTTPESNRSESNPKESNKSEYKNHIVGITDKNSFKKISPNDFKPKNEEGYTALFAWEKLEPNHPESFGFYLFASRNIPPDKIHQFVSEIEQDASIKNRGAVFVKKVKDWNREKRNA